MLEAAHGAGSECWAECGAATHSSSPAPQVAALGPADPLPADLVQRCLASPYGLLRAGRYADRLAPWLQHFKREE